MKQRLTVGQKLCLFYIVPLVVIGFVSIFAIRATKYVSVQQELFSYISKANIEWMLMRDEKLPSLHLDDDTSFNEFDGIPIGHLFIPIGAIGVPDCLRCQTEKLKQVIQPSDIHDFAVEILEQTKNSRHGSFKYKTQHLYYARLDNQNGVWTSVVRAELVDGIAARDTAVYTIPLSILAFIGLMLSVYLLRAIILPLRTMRKQIQRLADHEWDQPVTIDSDDEIGGLASAMEKLRLQLQNEEEAQKQMLQTISHDLKTPISIIRACAESIQDEVYPYGTLKDTATVIVSQSERLEHKVSDLLYITQLDYMLERDTQTYGFIDVGTLIQEVVRNMHNQLPTLSWDLHVQSAYYYGSKEAWQIVFENLLSNAQRYAKQMIRIEVDSERIEIANDGEPIDETILSNLFTPYVKGKKGSTGLGLTIVARSMQLLHCQISVKNTPQVTFTIRKAYDEALQKRAPM